MEPFSLKWLIDEECAGKEIKEFLAEEKISKKALTNIKYKGGLIIVNGKERNVRFKLQVNDRLKVIFPPELPNENLLRENIPLTVVYEDRDVLIIDKPPYMNTIPSREHPTGSLANGLVYYFEKAGIQSRVHIVTRLDRNTSGLVVIAKHSHAHHLFSLLQREAGIHRQYEAIAHGAINKKSSVIDAPIGRKADSIIEREIRNDGKRAVTHYKVHAQYNGYTHVQLQLMTGRTHQIRIHMAYIGHPLLGDDLYGGMTDLIQRQALHCSKIQFFHPLQKKELIFHSVPPKDMTSLL